MTRGLGEAYGGHHDTRRVSGWPSPPPYPGGCVMAVVALSKSSPGVAYGLSRAAERTRSDSTWVIQPLML